MSLNGKALSLSNLKFAGLAILIIFVLLAAGSVQAEVKGAPMVVTTYEDVVDYDDALCSLREAVIASNTPRKYLDVPIGECLPTRRVVNTILLPPGLYELSRYAARPESRALSGDLDIYNHVTIEAQGPGLVVIHAVYDNDRVFEITKKKNVTFRRLTISGGNSPASGGGISNNGNLVLENVTLTNNKAAKLGGALFSKKNVTLVNVTITGNEARKGSGLRRSAGKLNVINSMIVGDSCSGTVLGRSGAQLNLLWEAPDCKPKAFGLDANPLLEPQEIAGLPGVPVLFGIPGDSPAAAAADNGLCPDVDQIGTPRPQGSGCDIGAFEVGDAAQSLIPDAYPDEYSTIEDTQLVVPGAGIAGVLDNDDANGSTTMIAAVVSGPAGLLNFNTDGSFTYTPPSQFTGTDKFTYEVSGDGGISAAAEVAITVSTDMFIEVTNTCDSGPGSLRAAMALSNTNPGVDTIIFAITDESCGSQVINLAAALPPITDQVMIDGLLQESGPNRTEPFIIVDGQNGGFSGFEIPVAGQGSIIRGLIIKNFGGSGVFIGSDGPSSGNIVEQNAITGNGFGNVQTGNVPSIPLNDGITIRDGVQNDVENNIFGDNADLDVDLGGDGFTPNDPQDPDEGANNLQNFPNLLTATPDGRISGLLNSIPDSDYTLQFFSSPNCSSEALTPLSTTSDPFSTDGDGNVFFEVDGGSLVEGNGIRGTASDVDGNTSELSGCIRVSDDNDVWPRARLIGSGDTISQFLDLPGQSRWFKIPIDPDSKIEVNLFDLPKNYDLALYTDIARAYAEQVSATEVDLDIIGAETAPAQFNPAQFNPAQFNPAQFNPAQFNPAQFNPAQFNPAQFNPVQNSGELIAPAIFNPAQFNPAQFNPAQFNPAQFNPVAANGNAYSAAQMASLIAVAANDGTAPEEIQVNSWNNTGFFYVRVTGRQAESDPDNPFSTSVQIVAGDCANLDLSPGSGSPSAQAGNYESLILVDWDRMIAKYGTNAGPGSPLGSKLNQLAAHQQVSGVVVDVSGQGRVAAANIQADNKETCTYAKNLVADSIKEVVDAYRDTNPNLQYVVVVGSDNDIPFYRLPDTTELGQEENYYVPVNEFSSSESVQRKNYYLSQDPYVNDLTISIDQDDVIIPHLAIGRLAETPDDIMSLIDAFLDTPVIQPKHAGVTAYDFLSDGGEAVRDVLAGATGLDVNDDLLVQNPDVWTADDLAGLINQSYPDNNNHGTDVLFTSGHFSANVALAADYETYYLSTDLRDSAVNLRGSLVMSPGCHASYNIVNEHNIPETFEPDWVQVFAQKGATLVSGTGYQYGETITVDYAERLYLEFARQLRSNASANIALGDALVGAKQNYLRDTPDWRGFDSKTMHQVTLWGLPMQKINMPGPRLNVNPAAAGISPSSLVDSSLIPNDPADVLGLRHFDLSRNYQSGPLQMTEVTKELTNTETDALLNASYLELGPNGYKSTIAGQPVLPLDQVDVSVTNTSLRGVGFLGGDLRDFANRQPLISVVTTEFTTPFPNYFSSVFDPLKLWNINRFDVFTRSGGGTSLFINPAQYKSTSTALQSTIMRRFDNMQLRLFYSDFTGTFNTGQSLNEPGLSGAPTINKVGAKLNGSGAVEFLSQVTVDPSAGVHQVWVTYITEVDPTPGGASATWQSLFLTQDPEDSRLWRGSLPGVGNPEAFRYIVQAVSGVGQVTMNNNLGRYYTISNVNTDPDSTSVINLSIVGGSNSGFTGDTIQFSAKLVGPGNAPLSNQTVYFGLGSNQRPATTDANGLATVDFPLLVAPGAYQVSAWFLGSTNYEPSTSAATLPFLVRKQPTKLGLNPAEATVTEGEPLPFVATLTDNDGDPLAEQTIRFELTPSGGGSVIKKAVITNPNGQAPLGAFDVPFGSYSVQAFFLGTGALKNSSSPVRNLTVEEFSPVVTPGFEFLADFEGLVKFRNFASGASGFDVLLGTSPIFPGEYTTYDSADSYPYGASNPISFSYDGAQLEAVHPSNNGAGSQTLVHALDNALAGPLNYVQIEIYCIEGGASAALNNVMLNGRSLGDFSSTDCGGILDVHTWNVTNIDLTEGFSLSGDLEISGFDGLESRELNKVVIRVGNID